MECVITPNPPEVSEAWVSAVLVHRHLLPVSVLRASVRLVEESPVVLPVDSPRAPSHPSVHSAAWEPRVAARLVVVLQPAAPLDLFPLDLFPLDLFPLEPGPQVSERPVVALRDDLDPQVQPELFPSARPVVLEPQVASDVVRLDRPLELQVSMPVMEQVPRLLAVSVEDAVPEFPGPPNQPLDLLELPDEVAPDPRDHPEFAVSPSMHWTMALPMQTWLPGEVSTAKLSSSPRPRRAS